MWNWRGRGREMEGGRGRMAERERERGAIGQHESSPRSLSKLPMCRYSLYLLY
jgi:hypothetical protein